jgi:ketosteroid isomerase-like protein
MAPASAAESRYSALLSPIRAFARAFNHAQKAFPSEAFTADCVVIDEFPPFVWARDRSARTWWNAAVALSGGNQHVTVGDVTYAVVAPNQGHVTVHMTLTGYSIRRHKHFVQHALYTAVERRTSNGWRITANSWNPADLQILK